MMFNDNVMNSSSFLLSPKTNELGQTLNQAGQSPNPMSAEAHTNEGQMVMDPGTPSYQCLMKNLEIHSPISSKPTLTPTRNNTHFQSPMLGTNASPLQPSTDVLFGTPSRYATGHQSSPNVGPRNSAPVFDHNQTSPFTHHQGSPFAAFGKDCKLTPTTLQLFKSEHDVSTPSPKLMPLKLVDLQSNDDSKPYDPSTAGSSMKSSPLVRSLDALDHEDATSTRNLGLEFSTPQTDPLLSTVKLTPKPSPHRNGHPPLPTIRLTPRSTPRRDHENGHPPLPSIRLTPRSTPRKRNLDQSVPHLMMDIDPSPTRIKLTPQNRRKVSVDDSIGTCPSSKSNPFTPDASLTNADPMISMVLNVDSNDTLAQELKHFPPITPKMNTKKSRSLFDPNSKDESIESLRNADAVVEVAKANESLTDDEDDAIEYADFVLHSPPSFVCNRKITETDSDEMLTESNGFNLNKKQSYLPMPGLKHSTSSTSLLGIKHLQDPSEQDDAAPSTNQPDTIQVDQFKGIRHNSSMCSLALSVDSMSGDAKRDLFTPPPIPQNGDGFRALSPPPLLPNPKDPHW